MISYLHHKWSSSINEYQLCWGLSVPSPHPQCLTFKLPLKIMRLTFYSLLPPSTLSILISFSIMPCVQLPYIAWLLCEMSGIGDFSHVEIYLRRRTPIFPEIANINFQISVIPKVKFREKCMWPYMFFLSLNMYLPKL